MNKKLKIGILDYGVGNVSSVLNLCRRINVESTIETNPNLLGNYNVLILPGVGSFDTAMMKIKDKGFYTAVSSYIANQNVTLIGICLGMQLLGLSSEEGIQPGFGFLNFNSKSFKSNENHLVSLTNMGWCKTQFTKAPFSSLNDFSEFKYYHVHSYFVESDDPSIALGYSYHGFKFINAVHSGNIYGFQFHPEKSHFFGEVLFKILFSQL